MRYILITILVIIKFVFFGQTTILSEDFNDGFPAGWQLIDNDGLTPNESVAVNFIDDAFVITEDYDTTGVGDSILVATSWFDEAGEADNWLILPSLTLGDYGNYISFDAKSMDASHPDGLEIRVSTGGINVWDFFPLEVAYANVAMNPEWTNYTVSLDSVGAVLGEDVFIAFRHYSDDNYILALDNIEVWIDDPVSVKEESKKLMISPNPSNGFINIEGVNNEEYHVYDLNGKTIESGKISSTNTLDLSILEAGVYFIQIGNYNPEKLIIE